MFVLQQQKKRRKSSTSREKSQAANDHNSDSTSTSVPADVAPSSDPKKNRTVILVKEMSEEMLDYLTTQRNIELPKSAIVKDFFGRHDPVLFTEKATGLPPEEEEIMIRIFTSQFSILMEDIKNIDVIQPEFCCQEISQRLSTDVVDLCRRTRISYAYWREERRCRITASICNKILTHARREAQDWKKKFNDIFYPKTFSSKYTKHGRDKEPEARAEFQKKTGMKVTEMGLVANVQVPFLACSPDGIVFDSTSQQLNLLEIKCPFKGKSMDLQATLDSQVGNGKFFSKNENGTYSLRKNHDYYAQMQLGMAVLNLQMTHFVIYCSKFKTMEIFEVHIDEPYLRQNLVILKTVFYKNILPEICAIEKESNKENNNMSDMLEKDNEK